MLKIRNLAGIIIALKAVIEQAKINKAKGGDGCALYYTLE